MGNVLAATYPDLIKAVSVYSGVAAGCFVGQGVAQWNNACSKFPRLWKWLEVDFYQAEEQAPIPKLDGQKSLKTCIQDIMEPDQRCRFGMDLQTQRSLLKTTKKN